MVKKLHHIARAGFSLLVACSIALPGVGFSAASNQAWADAQARAVNDPPPTTLAEAKTNLDTANALKSDAAAEEAAAKAALDAAKAAHTTASANHETATSAVDQATTNATAKIAEIVAKAQAEYDAADARVKETAAANTAAQNAKAEAQSKLVQAQSEYEAAQEAYNTLANSKDAELQQASEKLREAESAYDAAVTQYKEAFNEYKVANNERNEAQSALNAAKKKVTECEAAVSAAQAKVNAAQKALDDAKAGLSAAADDDQKAALQAAVSEAQAKLDTAKGEKTAAQSRLTTAQSEQSAAQQAVTDAEAAVEAAKANTGGVDIDALQAAVDEAQKKYDDAKAAYESGAKDAGVEKPYQQALNEKIAAEKACKEADELVTSTLQNLNAAKEELAAITAGGGGDLQKVLSVKEFFDEQGSTAASSLFDTMEEATETKSGSPGDATDVFYVFEMLNLFGYLNSERSSILLPDLRIIDEQMAYEVIRLNYASATHSYNIQSSHCELFAFYEGESEWGKMHGLNMFYDLYSKQQEIWYKSLDTYTYTDSNNAEIPLPNGWTSMSPWLLSQNCNEFYQQVSLYANITSRHNVYVSGASSYPIDGKYGFVLGFSSYVEGEGLETYSVDEWKNRLRAWYDYKVSEPIATAATDEEIAAAQKKVDDAQKDYEDAVADRTTKEGLRDAAVAQFQAAESVKSLEDALTQADGELADAKQAHDAAVASVGDLDDPNHPLNVAVADAKRDLATKTQSVVSIQNEISTLETKISQLTTARDEAQTALDNYTAADTTAQEVALAAAKRELETAQRELEAAQAEVTRLTNLVTELRNKCTRLSDKQTNVRDNVMTPARQASDKAKAEFLEVAKKTQEESELRAFYGAKNNLDKKRDAYNKLVWDMPEVESNADVAARSVATASDNLTAASEKLAAAKKLSLAGVMASPIAPDDYSEFLVLNDHAQNVKEAQALVSPAADKKDAAKADLDAKQAAYDAAHAKHVSATADQVEAQRIYDSFLGLNDDTNKPGTSTTPGNSTSNGSSDPVVEPWNPGKPAGASGNGSSVGNAGNKGAATGAATVGEGQGGGTEAEATNEAVAEEATEGSVAPHIAQPRVIVPDQSNSINPFIIAGIVFALLAVVAAVILIVIWHRRKNASQEIPHEN